MLNNLYEILYYDTIPTRKIISTKYLRPIQDMVYQVIQIHNILEQADVCSLKTLEIM